MKTEQEIHDLTKKSIQSLTNLFLSTGSKLRVPETDAIVETIYGNFFANSIASIPKHLREEYIKNRLDDHGRFLTEVVNDIIKMVDNEEIDSVDSNKETIH